MSKQPKPIYRLPPGQRQLRIAPFLGRHGEAVVRFTGDETRSYTGTLVCVARPNVGTVADLLIVKGDDGHCVALSLATLIRVRATTRGRTIGREEREKAANE